MTAFGSGDGFSAGFVPAGEEEDPLDALTEGDIDAQSAGVETGDVVVAGGVFQDDLDEALEKIIKA